MMRIKHSIFLVSYINMGNLPSKKGDTRNESVHQSRSPGPDLDESVKKKVNPLAIFGIQENTKQEIVEFLESPAFKKRYL